MSEVKMTFQNERPQDLWGYFWEERVLHARPFDRDFVWVSIEVFERVRDKFVREVNFLHIGKSFRSRSIFVHIHAVYQEEHVFIHKDFGNIAIFPPLGILHLFWDVLPYVFFARKKKVPFRTLFLKPQK